MRVRPASRSPRRVIALFLTLVLVPSALLVGVGWQLFQNDRQAARRDLEERRRQLADVAVSLLDQRLQTAERLWRDPASLQNAGTHGDAASIVITAAGTVVTGGAVAFLPSPSPGRAVPTEPFAEADSLARRGDRDQAKTRYENLTRSSDPAVRAGAWLGLRSITGDPGLFERLASIQGVAVEGVPAELFARVERCRVLVSLGRQLEIRKEAALIRDELLAGKWSISRAAFEANLHDVREWSRESSPQNPTAAERLAEAIATWWDFAGSTSPAGRWYDSSTGTTILWSSDAEKRTLLAALPSFVEREWLAPTMSTTALQKARVEIRGPDAQLRSSDTELRTPEQTGLPWTVAVSHADPAADLRHAETRRSIWLAGLGAMVLFLAAGAYLVTRVISRELAVARLQSDFVAAVSHELRTPLTSMRQLTEILVDARVTDHGRLHSYYQALARQTDRLHRLVESLLDLGRLETGQSPYRLEPLDACALVRTVVEDFRRDTAGQGVRVDLDLDGATIPVAGDKDALTNALWNLLDNAVKYSPDSRTAWVSVHPERGRLLIRVRDEGIGIPRDEQRTVFDKFVRGARAKADGFKGTGIGLSMVRHIVAAHGGDVVVQSEPGAGSTFTLALPLLANDHSSLSTDN